MIGTPQSDRQAVVILKFWLPTILIFGATLLFFNGHPHWAVLERRSLVSGPLALLGIFLLTVAEVKIERDALVYRRAFRWRFLRYDRIRKCSASWFPGLASLKLDRFALPWGKVYFVILQPGFSTQDNDLVRKINEHRKTSFARTEDARDTKLDHTGAKRVGPKQIFLLMFVVGMLYSVVLGNFLPFVFDESHLRSLPYWAARPTVALIRSSSWPWAILTTAVLTVAIVVKRFGRGTAMLALVLGAILGRLVFSSLN
jgi:hypothetical protein